MKGLLIVYGFSLILLAGYSSESSAEPNCTGAYDTTWAYDFKTACFKHDVCYSEGKLLGFTKAECDSIFKEHMDISCMGRSFICDFMADKYYSAVRNMPQKVYDDASSKSDRSIEFLKTSTNTEAVEFYTALLNQRKAGQRAWTKKYRECKTYPDESPQRIACGEVRSAIEVPNIPHEFNMGECNILGINWKNGHRTKNAFRIARQTPNVQYSDIVADRDGDACKGNYRPSALTRYLK